MNRDEILAKAKNENTNQLDERELQIQQKGNELSSLGILVFLLILMIAKIIKHETVHDVLSLMLVNMAVPHIYKGVKFKKTKEIVLGSCFSLLSIIFLISAVITILK